MNAQTTSHPDVIVQERTRERLLHVITQQGPIGAVELAEQLELTVSGIRRHLQAMCDDGAIIERESAPTVLQGQRGRGRPSKKYVASHTDFKTHPSLPRDYEGLAVQALDHLKRLGGDAALKDFAATRWQSLTAQLGADFDELPNIKAKVERLAAVMSHTGYAASVRPVPALRGIKTTSEPHKQPEILSVQLCQGNCPVQHAAKQYPQLCEAETEGLTQLLGVPVQRLATLAQGGHSCTTNIPLTEGTPQ